MSKCLRLIECTQIEISIINMHHTSKYPNPRPMNQVDILSLI